MLENEKRKLILDENLTDENLNNLFDLFSDIYYENDLIVYSNCYDYNIGVLNIFQVIELLKENNIKLKIEYEY